MKPAFLGHWLDENVPGGARWAYVFGSALVFLLLAQLASGLALAMSYSASVPAAWASVAQIEQSRLGHLLRGLHANFTRAHYPLHPASRAKRPGGSAWSCSDCCSRSVSPDRFCPGTSAATGRRE